MTETKEQNKIKRLGPLRPGKLELKKTIEMGQVRQSFSHGRSKMVTVEVKKKRTFAPDSGGRMAEVTNELQAAKEIEETQEEERLAVPDEALASHTETSPTLTSEEKATRVRALEDAKRTGETAAAGEPVEKEAASEGEDVPSPDQREVTPQEEDKLKNVWAKAAAKAAAAAKLEAGETEYDAELRGRAKRGGLLETRRPPPTPRRTEPRRRAGKLTISEALEDQEERTRSLASFKRAREREKQKAKQHRTEGKKIIRDVVVPETITVQELANRMAERVGDVIKALMKMDVMVTINQTIDADTAELVVEEFNHRIKRVAEADVEIGLMLEDCDVLNLQPRAPVVTVMGHVDHGKTSLLDALRETDVAVHESGGITQHIGAYQVTMASGAKISFIDTPGHAAFTKMRARGAQVTDIVVLCIAADDGIMPQTIEAIHHAKVAEVPIVVAINKIDKPAADVNRVRTELLQHDLQVEEMGGEVLSVEVSATEETNLDKVEEAILLQAELLDLKANPDRPASGVIVEAKVEQGRGSVATVLVQNGTLRVGDIIVAGGEWGRVRALVDASGNSVEEAGPSVPVEVLGLNDTPAAGDEVATVDSEGRAREITEFRQREIKKAKIAAGSRSTLEQMFEKIKEDKAAVLQAVVKADVHGSVEAILGALENLSTDEVKVQVLHSGVGGINESDVTLASASDAVIIGFNVRSNPQARQMAGRDQVEILYYSIIYNLIDDLKKMLSGLLAPEIKEMLLGYAEIREVFNISKIGRVAGCIVNEGQVKRGARVRLIRDEVVLHEGELSQLKRFKGDVKDVKEGTECGMAFTNYQNIEVGDMIECFEVEEFAREL